MAKEIEILWALEMDIKSAADSLAGMKFKGSSRVIDTYFFDPLRDDLKEDENGKLWKCLRLRENNLTSKVAYKIDKYDGDIWQYSDEYETGIENASMLKNIFANIGLQELVVIDNHKHKYVDVDNKFEIVLEEVTSLGNFIEIEWNLIDNNDDYLAAKESIREFVLSLGIKIGPELNSGKPELMLAKIKENC